jgi:hypothetical protein
MSGRLYHLPDCPRPKPRLGCKSCYLRGECHWAIRLFAGAVCPIRDAFYKGYKTSIRLIHGKVDDIDGD